MDKKIDSNFDTLDKKIDSKFTYLDKKIDTTANKIIDDLTEVIKDSMSIMVTRTEFNERIDDLEAQIGPQGRRLDRLEDKVRKISAKVGLDK